jgi:DNA modification methylase
MKNKRTGVDFGLWDRGSFDLLSWIPLYVKLLDKNGSFIIFCSYRFISQIIEILEKEAGMNVKDIIVWQKTNPMPRNIDRRYVQDMEFAIWAVKKNAKWVFNKPKDIPYLRAFYSTSTVAGKERVNHPTQKSLLLMKNIIDILTNENDVILDPFMGSGTTGVASLELGRKFIGVEMSPEYFSIAQQRITEMTK